MNLMINLCVFEDAAFHDLMPLTYVRPAYDLLLGISSLLDKIRWYFDHVNLNLHCRDYLKLQVKAVYPNLPVNNINTGSPCLFINGRVVMTLDVAQILENLDTEHNQIVMAQGQVIALYLMGDALTTMKILLEGTPNSADLIQTFRPVCVAREIDRVLIVNQLWDLVNLNDNAIRHDFRFQNKPGILKGHVQPLTAVYNELNVFVDKDSMIEDFVVLNANDGPIYIDENVVVEAHSRLVGPLYIGKNSRICGGSIRNASIGANCKVAGEVANTIFIKNSNKAHAGFIGHSYVGEWVNLGAMTTNSNLKNTYSTVELQTLEHQVQTEQLFCGAFIGDHVKTGIGTLLNTGTLIGFGSSIFGTGLHDKYIAPFSWGTPGRYEPHLLNKLISTARKMKERRKVELTENEKEVISLLYHNQFQERMQESVPS